MKRRTIWLLVVGWVLWRLLGKEVGPKVVGAQSRPEGPTGRTIIAGNHEFFVREAGPEDGRPLVLLHGWLYDGHATWHRVLPLLTTTYRVYVLDLRNHGKTDRLRTRFEIADMADDVARVLEVLGLGSVPVVGYSMGGMTAQELAIRHPGRVECLVLGATSAHPVALPRWLTVPVFLMGRALSRIDRTLLPRLAHRYLMKTGAVPPQHSEWLWQVLLDRDVDLYYEAGFAILRFDARERLGSIGVRTMSIIPTRDQLVRPHLQRATAEIVGSDPVVIIPDAGHEAVLTHPDVVAQSIRDFVR